MVSLPPVSRHLSNPTADSRRSGDHLQVSTTCGTLPWVVVKCEVNTQGTNRRAVITNRPGAFVLPGAAYDDYSDRGESENRNKELKCGLQADRLSDHRYMANLFRLYLHATAYNLLARLRRLVANPPPEPEHAEVPSEALGGRSRRRHHNRRVSEQVLAFSPPACDSS